MVDFDYDADGIQVTNYAWLSWKITHRIFCCVKKFSLAGVDVKYLFYIYLAYGIRWKVGDHGVPHQCWSCSTNVIRWKVEDHVVAHHWSFVWWFIEGVSYWPLIITATFSQQDLWSHSAVKAAFLNKFCDHSQQLKQPGNVS